MAADHHLPAITLTDPNNLDAAPVSALSPTHDTHHKTHSFAKIITERPDTPTREAQNARHNNGRAFHVAQGVTWVKEYR
jgi:hypothetical protein